MRNVLTICTKEIHSYFASPIAYLLMALFAVIFGFFFSSATLYFVQASMQGPMSGRGPMDVNEWVVRPLLSNAGVVGLFLIPMISMRLFAEEKRSGTIELLLTSPVRDWEIVLGKFLAALQMYLCILLVAVVNMSLLFAFGKPDWKPLLCGLLGLVLQSAALLAIGTFISTTTKNQIIAGGVAFAVCLLLWVLDWITAFESGPVYKTIAYLSVISHFESFSKGVIDSKDVLFYLSLTFFGLFLTARSLESLRWRS